MNAFLPPYAAAGTSNHIHKIITIHLPSHPIIKILQTLNLIQISLPNKRLPKHINTSKASSYNKKKNIFFVSCVTIFILAHGILLKCAL
jgi:hypothetical protein